MDQCRQKMVGTHTFLSRLAAPYPLPLLQPLFLSRLLRVLGSFWHLSTVATLYRTSMLYRTACAVRSTNWFHGVSIGSTFKSTSRTADVTHTPRLPSIFSLLTTFSFLVLDYQASPTS